MLSSKRYQLLYCTSLLCFAGGLSFLYRLKTTNPLLHLFPHDFALWLIIYIFFMDKKKHYQPQCKIMGKKIVVDNVNHRRFMLVHWKVSGTGNLLSDIDHSLIT